MSELRYDPEWYERVRSVLENVQMRECLPPHDFKDQRKKIGARVRANPFKLPEDIEQTIRYARSHDGHEIPIYHYGKCHFRHLGMVPYVAAGAEIFSIDYHLAPENPFTTLLEDCWAVLAWIQSSAAELCIDPKRIALFGESTGGRLAVALAMVARYRGFSPPLSKQILIYPMIDDRTEMDHTGERDVFKMVDRVTSWVSYLGSCKDLTGCTVIRLRLGSVTSMFKTSPVCILTWNSWKNSCMTPTSKIAHRVREQTEFNFKYSDKSSCETFHDP